MFGESGAHWLLGLAAAITLVAGRAEAARAAEIGYVDAAPSVAHVTVDVRPAAQCLSGSLPDARCLPAADVVGPHRRLPNVSGLLWLLGSAGLDGSEHVLVVGDDGKDRELIAGLLHLAGQHRVSILTRPVTAMASAGGEPQRGRPRSLTRELIFQAPMRSNRIILREELAEQIASASPPVILDGRSDDEYWGQRIRAARGGHVPGAQSSPLDDWRAEKGAVPPVYLAAASPVVVYGHDAPDSIVMMARVAASGASAQVLLDGWVGWAADGGLPVDSATFPASASASPAKGLAGPGSASQPVQLVISLVLAGVALAAAGYAVGRMRRGMGHPS